VSISFRIMYRYPSFVYRNFHIIPGFEMVKNSPGNDNGAARVDGRRSGASRGECTREDGVEIMCLGAGIFIALLPSTLAFCCFRCFM